MRARTDAQLLVHLLASSAAIPEAGCWLWLGALDADGYGQVGYRGKNARAHRASWLLHGGSACAVLMHRCDTPACINPHHLTPGTQATNNADKMAKGRHRVASGDEHYMRRNPAARAGERAPRARLTEQQVRDIRARSEACETQSALAEAFGVTRAAISAIVVRRTWKHTI